MKIENKYSILHVTFKWRFIKFCSSSRARHQDLVKKNWAHYFIVKNSGIIIVINLIQADFDFLPAASLNLRTNQTLTSHSWVQLKKFYYVLTLHNNMLYWWENMPLIQKLYIYESQDKLNMFRKMYYRRKNRQFIAIEIGGNRRGHPRLSARPFKSNTGSRFQR